MSVGVAVNGVAVGTSLVNVVVGDAVDVVGGGIVGGEWATADRPRDRDIGVLGVGVVGVVVGAVLVGSPGIAFLKNSE